MGSLRRDHPAAKLAVAGAFVAIADDDVATLEPGCLIDATKFRNQKMYENDPILNQRFDVFR